MSEIELDKSQNTHTDEELKEILKGERIDLSNAVLIGIDLRRANLKKANLAGTDLSHANLTEVDLSHANLTGAHLSHADFTRANLNEADLKEAVLIKTDFRQATLIGSDFTKAQLFDVDFREANCENAIFINTLVDDIKIEKTNLLRTQFLSLGLQNLFLNHNIQEAQNALANSLTSADERIKEYSKNAKMIGRIALELMSLNLLAIILFWYHYEKFIPLFDKLNAWALTLFSFPMLIILTISVTLFRHQKKLLDEVRHYSGEKRQIELYSGLLKASQYASAGIDNAQYIQDTFTAIRDRLLSEQMNTNTAGSAVEKEDYGLEPIIKVISDMIAKSEVKK